MKTLRIAKTLVAMAAVAACMGAWADRRWTGGGETADWGDSGNWDGGSGNHVFRHSVQDFTKKTVSFSSVVDLANELWIQNNESSFGDTEPIVFTANVATNGLKLTKKLNIASNSDGNGYLEVASGTHTFGSGTEIGGGSCAGTFRQSGGTVNASGWFCVGLSGTGYHNQIAGSFIHSGSVAYIVGQGTGSGTSTVSGGTMTLNGVADTSGYSVYVGENAGTGVWNLSGNAVVTTAKKVGLGKSNTAGRGYLNVADNAVLAVNDELWVGLSGIGHLTVSNNASVSCTDLVLSRNDYDEADENASTATISGGEVTCTKLWLPFGKNRKAVVKVSGGTLVSTGANSNIGRGYASTCDFTVSNGVFKAYEDVYIGGEGSAVVNVEDGGYMTVGWYGRDKWAIMNNSVGDGSKSQLNLNSGVFATKSIKANKERTNSAEINFNGGTLLAYTTESDGLIQNSSGLTVNVLEGGARVYVTNSYTTAIKKPLLHGGAAATDGGLVKLGTGTLTLTEANTYTGDTIVEEGVLSVSGSLATTNLKLAGGTVSGVSSWNTVVITNGLYHYSALPATDAVDYEMTGGTLVMTAAEVANDSNKKVVVKGGTLVIDGSASTYAAGDTITIEAAAFDGVTSAESVRVAGTSLDWSVSGNTVTAATPSDASNYWIGGASGDWTEISNWRFDVPNADLEAVFTNDVVVAMTENDKNYKKLVLNTESVALVRGTGGEKLHVGGIEGWGTLTLNHLGLGQINNRDVTITNDIVFAGTEVSWLGDYNYGGALHMKGNLSGSGPCEFWNNIKLYGDNSGLTGNAAVKQNTFFMSAKSASSNAVWSIESDLRFDFEGTISFGRFSNSHQKMYYCDHTKTVTIEVGHLGGNSSFNSLSWFGDLTYAEPNEKLANYTIKKVGGGTLTYAAYGIPNIVVEEGELVLAPTQYNDNHANLGFDSIVVKNGAILSGTTTNADKPAATQAISALTLAEGAIVRQTVARSGEEGSYVYSCPTLAVDGTVGVDGTKFDLVDDYGFLAGATSGETTRFTLLSATAVNGTPLAYRDIPMATRKWAWLPKNTGTAVVMQGKCTRTGFVIVVQ